MSRDLSGKTLTLVPNRGSQQLRLAQAFREAPDETAMAAPAVEVLSLWSGKVLETSLLLLGRPAPRVPAHFQIRRLWERAIRETSDETLLPGELSALARDAMEADRLCEHWLVPRNLEPGRDWRDEGFCTWRRQVHRNLAAEDWLSPAGPFRGLCELLGERERLPMSLPACIRLVGFIEITPLERRWLEALERIGVRVEHPEPGREEAPRPSLVYNEPADELRGAADWAAARLRAGDRRVAVAVNGLDAMRSDLERVFLQRFHPEAALAAAPPPDAAFHVHGGRPLSSSPLVAAALDLLELSSMGLRQSQPYARISRWLLSPCWAGSDDEAAARARLDLALRRKGRYEWSLAAVAEAGREADVPVLVERVGRLAPGSTKAPPARRFFHCLRHWGWPGPAATGSEARRAVDGLRQALEDIEFADVRDAAQALAELRKLALERTLPGPGGILSPVQVLAVEDVPGQRFDAVRVINVHADNWPAPVRLNRLLPFELSRHLPRARAKDQLAQNRALQAGVQASAPHVVFSRAAQIDGVPTGPSPLVESRHRAGADQPGSAPESCEGAQLARAAWPDAGTAGMTDGRDALEAIPLERGPSLGTGELPLHGALSVLNLQSACPWAAFLVHRLDASFPALPSAFADQAFTGSLVHRALERLYRPHAERGSLPTAAEIPAAVDDALAFRHAEWILPPGALAAERTRLERLLSQWLDHEGTLPFGTPWQLEADREASFAGFRFTVRMDRIDRMSDGGLVLDYKTGRLRTPNWGATRMTEVQLPLYAVLTRDDPLPALGVGLLAVRSGDMHQRLWSGDPTLVGKGMVVMSDRKSSPFPSWDEAVDAWASSLHDLFDEFRAGDTTFLVHHEAPLAWLGLDLLLRQCNLLDSEETSDE